MMTVTRFDEICQQWVAAIPDLADYVRVITESHTIEKLSDRRGIQLVGVLPSYGRSGNSVTPIRTQTALFWVVEKMITDNRDSQELEQMQRIQNVVLQLEQKIMVAQETGCSDWNRLEISSIDIQPERGVFGGWCGYYLTFEF